MRRASLAAVTLAAAAGIHTATAQTAGLPQTAAAPQNAVAPQYVIPRRPPAATTPRTAVAPRSVLPPRPSNLNPQETPTLTATISQGFTLDTNYDLDPESAGTTYYADTGLGLSLLRDTSTQFFEFAIDTGLRALWEAEQPFEFTLASPTGGLVNYAQEGTNSAFDALLRYRQRRTETQDFEDFVADEGALPDNLQELRGDSRELRFDADVDLRYGINDPSSYGLRFFGSVIDYADNTAGQTPRRSGQVDASWTLGFSPVLSTIVVGSYFRYEADNAPETSLQVAEVDAGLVYQPDENVRLRGGIGYADRTKEETINGVRQTTDNNSGATLRGDFFYTQDAFNLLGDGRLTTAAPQTRFSFNVNGNYLLARGTLTGRIFNRYTTKDNGTTEVRVAGLGLGVVRDLNSVSRLGLDFSLANEVNLDNDNASDITRTIATATYSYDLTEVVTADLGYRYQSRLEDPDDATSQRVFFVIGRTFQTGL